MQGRAPLGIRAGTQPPIMNHREHWYAPKPESQGTDSALIPDLRQDPTGRGLQSLRHSAPESVMGAGAEGTGGGGGSRRRGQRVTGQEGRGTSVPVSVAVSLQVHQMDFSDDPSENQHKELNRPKSDAGRIAQGPVSGWCVLSGQGRGLHGACRDPLCLAPWGCARLPWATAELCLCCLAIYLARRAHRLADTCSVQR